MSVELEKLVRGDQALVFVNVGVRDFGQSLREQGCAVVEVDWSPPAGGDAALAGLLDDLL
jgi:hypothetical protein